MTRELRMVAVGECTIDRYLDLGEERVGGISLNFAIQARLSGADDVSLVSCIGTDAAAAAVRGALTSAGVKVTQLHEREGRTATQAIHLAPGGERIFPPGGFDAGVLSTFHLGPDDFAVLRGATAIAVPYFAQLAHIADPIIEASDLQASLFVDLLDGADLGAKLEAIDRLLDRCEVLFISGDESTVERLIPRVRHARSVVVVTQGAAGSSAVYLGVRHHVAAESVPPDELVDSTGCGDAYQAAFTVRYMKDRDVHAAMRAGGRRAAQVIRHLGATSRDR